MLSIELQYYMLSFFYTLVWSNKVKAPMVILSMAALISGCVSGISGRQELELKTYEARGLAI